MKAAAILQAHAGAESRHSGAASGLTSTGGQHKHEAHVVTLDCADGFARRISAKGCCEYATSRRQDHAKMRRCAALTRIPATLRSNQRRLLEEACTLSDYRMGLRWCQNPMRRAVGDYGPRVHISTQQRIFGIEERRSRTSTRQRPSRVLSRRCCRKDGESLACTTAMEKAARTPTTTHVPAARKTRSPITQGGEHSSDPYSRRRSAAKRLPDTEHGCSDYRGDFYTSRKTCREPVTCHVRIGMHVCAPRRHARIHNNGEKQPIAANAPSKVWVPPHPLGHVNVDVFVDLVD